MRPLLGFLLLSVLCGCQPSAQDPYFIRSNPDFIAANEEVLRLTKGPFTKIDNQDELTEKDVTDLRESLRIIKGMIRFNPRSFSLYQQAGTIHLALDEPEAAVDQLMQFQQYIPNDLDPTLKPLVTLGFFRFSEALFRVQRYEDAELAINRTLQDAPEEPKFLVQRATIRIQLGQLKEAERDLRKALAIDPRVPRGRDLLKFLTERPSA
jgi:tetratricopeptide (TPR) repeat protein